MFWAELVVYNLFTSVVTRSQMFPDRFLATCRSHVCFTELYNNVDRLIARRMTAGEKYHRILMHAVPVGVFDEEMSSRRLQRELDQAKSDLIGILRSLLLFKREQPMLIFPGFPKPSRETTEMTRSDSQASNISDYLDVERSKSLHSALKKCTRSQAEKKVVSFADSMGLDLCQVRPVFPYNSSDEDLVVKRGMAMAVPVIRSPSKPRPPQLSSFINCPRYLHLQTFFPVWRDPIEVQKELIAKAKANNVCLKSTKVTGMMFSGIILVKNLAYDKKVSVRYTLDDWRSFVDTNSSFVSCIQQEGLDNFSFQIFLPSSIPVGAKCIFCIRYRVGNVDYWDNNEGQNYVLQVRTMADTYADVIQHHAHPVFY